MDAKDKVDALVEQTKAAGKAFPGLLLEETASPSISKEVDQQRGGDLALSEKITLLITLITLLVVFGSVTMAGVPLLLALSSIAAAVGLSMLASHFSPDAGAGTNVILMIGLAVGVDYTLFHLKRGGQFADGAARAAGQAREAGERRARRRAERGKPARRTRDNDGGRMGALPLLDDSGARRSEPTAHPEPCGDGSTTSHFSLKSCD